MDQLCQSCSSSRSGSRAPLLLLLLLLHDSPPSITDLLCLSACTSSSWFILSIWFLQSNRRAPSPPSCGHRPPRPPPAPPPMAATSRVSIPTHSHLSDLPAVLTRAALLLLMSQSHGLIRSKLIHNLSKSQKKSVRLFWCFIETKQMEISWVDKKWHSYFRKSIVKF